MKYLKNPEKFYGPLLRTEKVDKMIADYPHLQNTEGALEYLEKHLGRVEENFAVLTNKDKGMWSYMLRVKAKNSFLNTTKALRVIMVYHKENEKFLGKLAARVAEKLEEQDELAPHYSYLLRQVEEIRKQIN